jgi:putative PIN family toxin of toxin-antitoxin system
MLLNANDTPTTQRPLWVFDTNVWLDLFVFDDPLCAGVRAALETRRIQVVISSRCMDEFKAVIAEPRWSEIWRARQGSELRCDDLIDRLRRSTCEVQVDPGSPALGVLPQCRDPHDQKFLQLAAASGAQGLVTKDRALLRLARRMRALGCTVCMPKDWELA